MTASVTHINGSEVRTRRGTNTNAVRCLRDVTKLVKSGEVVGVMVALQYADGSAGTSKGGFIRTYPIVGALEDMKHKLLMDE